MLYATWPIAPPYAAAIQARPWNPQRLLQGERVDERHQRGEVVRDRSGAGPARREVKESERTERGRAAKNQAEAQGIKGGRQWSCSPAHAMGRPAMGRASTAGAPCCGCEADCPSQVDEIPRPETTGQAGVSGGPRWWPRIGCRGVACCDCIPETGTRSSSCRTRDVPFSKLSRVLFRNGVYEWQGAVVLQTVTSRFGAVPPLPPPPRPLACLVLMAFPVSTLPPGLTDETGGLETG